MLAHRCALCRCVQTVHASCRTAVWCKAPLQAPSCDVLGVVLELPERSQQICALTSCWSRLQGVQRTSKHVRHGELPITRHAMRVMHGLKRASGEVHWSTAQTKQQQMRTPFRQDTQAEQNNQTHRQSCTLRMPQRQKRLGQHEITLSHWASGKDTTTRAASTHRCV
jgi:hypothetical protein